MQHKRIDVGESNEKRWTIFSFCGFCGAELLGGESFFKEYKYNMPFKIAKSELLCPVCRHQVWVDLDFTEKVPGYYHFVYNTLKDPDGDEYDNFYAEETDYKDESAIWIESVERNDINDIQLQRNFDFLRQKRAYYTISNADTLTNINTLCESAERQKAEHVFNGNNEIGKKPELLKRFLECLINIETSIYSSKKRLLELYKYKAQIVENATIHRNTVGMAEKQQVANAETRLRNIPTEASFSTARPKKPMPPKEPIFRQAGLFNKKKVQEENAFLLANYNKEVKQYEDELQKYERSLALFNETVKEKIETEKKEAEQALKEAKISLEVALSSKSGKNVSELEAAIDSDIQSTSDMLQAQIKCKNEMYATGIVYGKYRNLVALSSFYEYLLAGRCTSLEGANGAYNIYEGEIRSNQIISQLADVVQSLEEIKTNQFMAYIQLQSVASDMTSLNGKMDSVLIAADYVPSIAKSAEMIAYNTEKTAYYAKKNKELTDALGFMVALK